MGTFEPRTGTGTGAGDFPILRILRKKNDTLQLLRIADTENPSIL